MIFVGFFKYLASVWDFIVELVWCFILDLVWEQLLFQGKKCGTISKHAKKPMNAKEAKTVEVTKEKDMCK